MATIEAEFRARLERLTGRWIPSPVVPGAVFRGLGRMVDRLRRFVAIDFPISAESMDVVTRWTVADSSRLLGPFGLAFRDGDETLADRIRSLRANGHPRRPPRG